MKRLYLVALAVLLGPLLALLGGCSSTRPPPATSAGAPPATAAAAPATVEEIEAERPDGGQRADNAAVPQRPAVPSRGLGMGGRGMGGRGMGGGGMGGDMASIHALLADHKKIRREVEDIPQGVRSVTTSDDADVAALIRKHVWQMKNRMEQGRPIRRMDPLFRELFAHHDKIHMEIEEVPGGARVVETSEDPQVVLLIRQHARRGVSEFVERGLARMHEPTPLPEGYKP